MDLLRKIFSGKGNGQNDPAIRFGRYTDAYKPDYKYDAWDKSLDLFEEGQYLESFHQFFNYLTDETQDNVKTWEENGVLRFEVLQGSKLISGEIGPKLIKAEARVARASKLNIGFLRRMMELNYNMKYSRYALDDNDHLTLIFDSYLLDGSPYKMYYALKEIAISADKQDDLLVREFKNLEPVNTGHLENLPAEQVRIKTEYLRSEIRGMLDYIDNGKFNTEQFAGGIGYLMLDMAYKLDYLVKPEGELTETFERIHRVYFSNDNGTSADKNLAVRKEFEKILERSEKDIESELYLVSCSFGITTPGNHEQLAAFVEAELKNMTWYQENRHTSIAMAFPGYLTGYSLFNYAYQPPVRDLLHLYYRITESHYFESLGFGTQYYDRDAEKLDKKAILDTIEEWGDRHRAKFPKLQFDTKALDFSSLVAFARSYYGVVRRLDLTKTGR